VLELRLVRYFVAVAEEGSVTRAAAAVRVAQPSLSRQIKQLEEILGAPLFERGGGRLQLSAAGRVFLPLAKDLIRRADIATNFLRAQTEPRAISLSLVAPETTVADVVAPFLAQRSGEASRVMVREAIPDAVFGDVAAGNADIGISSGTAPTGLASRPIIRTCPRPTTWRGTDRYRSRSWPSGR
jgi:DNA-binding transcriptional LysR family regulator